MKLTQDEQEILSGKRGEAAKIALEIIIELGELYGAAELIPVSKAHIDGCLYGAVGEAGLEFAEKMHQMGGVSRYLQPLMPIPGTLIAG